MAQSTAAGIPPSEGLTSDWSVEAARSVTALQLVDSMLHDVRNPLNALSINLDVLTEKLRAEQGEIHPSQAKNLKVMREQILRVDGLLRQYAEFLSPERGPAEHPVDFSDAVSRSLGVLGHEHRRSMIRVRQLIEPGLRVATLDQGTVRFLALHVLSRAAARAGYQGEVDVTLQREAGAAVLRVRDSLQGPAEPFEHAIPALHRAAAGLGAKLVWDGPELMVTMPVGREG